MTTTATKPVRWRYVHDGYRYLYDVGIKADGTLHNPRGYPEDHLRTVIQGVQERLHARRSAAAKKAAKTRADRKEKRVYAVVQRLKNDGTFIPAPHCEICGKALDDTESRARGIGSDCWQQILQRLEAVS